MRHPRYLLSRLTAVVGRYGLGSRAAKARVRRCVQTLASHGLHPTFATPGTVVERHPDFFRELHDAGAELAVHGYDHADFRRLSPQQASWQFERAIEAYARHGIPCEGFRCPYLSYTAAVRARLPEGAFAYSSNRAIAWQLADLDTGGPVFDQLAANYRAGSSAQLVCVPTIEDGLVEIPASVPDDLQLCDGLGLGPDGVLRTWRAMLRASHDRGELLAPLFHPEAYDLLDAAVDGVLETARELRPAVWLTQLRDVAAWWRERATFGVRWERDGDGLSVQFTCSDRATVLSRGLPQLPDQRPWDGTWSIVAARRVRVDDDARPFVGLQGVDAATAAFLREQGYAVDDGDRPAACSITLSRGEVERLGSRRALIDHLDRSAAPLLRYARWPAEAKSTFCLAGDLDALSWRDYADRLRPAVRARRGHG